MIKLNDHPVKVEHFPDNSQHIILDWVQPEGCDPVWIKEAEITWLYESDEEMATLLYLVGWLGETKKTLFLPYIPNARMDRVKQYGDVFTLKYFASFINSLGFSKVLVLDPHSDVAPALINHVTIGSPIPVIENVLENIGEDNTVLFFPDQGAAKRYGSMIKLP